MAEINFDTVLTALTVAAGLSLLVERIVEALRHVIESTGSSHQTSADSILKGVKSAAHIVTQTTQALIKDKDKSPRAIANALKQAVESDSNQSSASNSAGITEAIEGDAMDEVEFESHSAVSLKLIQAPTPADIDWRKLQIFFHFSALGVGILVACAMDIHLLSLLFNKGDIINSHDLEARALLAIDEILSGLVIAGGSQPIHVLLRFLTTRKSPSSLLDELEDQSEESKVSLIQSGRSPNSTIIEPVPSTRNVISSLVPSLRTVAIPLPTGPLPTGRGDTTPTDTSSWMPIEYYGGVKPEKLQQRNLRSGNPNLVVFHHTAMNSELGFQAIVDEFLINKGWSTGYHCVIMPNGAVRPFCRWDRVGNHTKGLNNRSLGVAFHGNFHSNPADKFSNHNGRFGIQHPTPEQLNSGAHLVALWASIYDDIEIDFDRHIMPHKEAKPGHTVCPGSNFPVEHFQNQIQRLHQQWQNSSYAQQQIELFKLKPYLYSEA